ncbi:MAG: hypothetical protein WD267_06225 [Balneolales bacterium]
MNLGIVGSTIIGGLLILSIIGLNLTVSQHSGENTLYYTAKIKTDMIAEVMTYDMRQVGYKPWAGVVIEDATENTFSFRTENISDGTQELIKWHFDSGSLIRTVNTEEVVMSSDVNNFEFAYFDSTGNVTTNKDHILQIKVTLSTESATRYGNRETNPSSAWDAVFTPRNLNL